MPNLLTISQAAAFVGVTVKTVRHYHRLGLVGEPERDGSGYRRYGSTDLLRLVQVRTLAGAGVALADVGRLLDAGPEPFAASLAAVERRLTERIEALVEQRRQLRRLAAGDHMLLPGPAYAVLDRFTELGFAPDFVAVQQEVLVLARAVAPEFFDSFLTQIKKRLDDPRYVDLLKRILEVERGGSDDQQLDELAADLADLMLAEPELMVVPSAFRARPDGVERYGLINYHRAEQWPISTRLTQLLEAKLRAAGIDVPRQ